MGEIDSSFADEVQRVSTAYMVATEHETARNLIDLFKMLYEFLGVDIIDEYGDVKTAEQVRLEIQERNPKMSITFDEVMLL